MELREAIRTRRSIRQYLDKGVDEQQVESLLRAAMAAPSAGDARTWDFVVVRDAAVKAKLASIHPGAAMITRAPVAIVVCGMPERERMAGFWPQDCSAATQNLLLAAHDAGLGAVWVGVYPLEELVAVIREAIGAPASVIPMAVVALGWPGEELPAEERYNPANVHHDQW